MKKRKLYILGALLIGAVITAALVYNVVFNAKHRVIADEKVDFVLPAEALQESFTINEQEAVVKYLDRVIQLSGKVTEVDETSVVLDERVQVNFSQEARTTFQTGQQLTVKGRCVGFDELLLQVKIDQASSIENTSKQ